MLAFASLKRVLFSGTAFAGLALALPGAAFAQADDPQPATQPSGAGTPTESETLVVTGTRVARDGYRAPTPLTVLNQDEIQNTSPTNNIADFVNQQPALAGSTRPSNSRLNISSGQAGINALNLRNLGAVRTLILLNGRRSVASTSDSVVDVNTIPQILVERVEIVTGGASATYGSDAVAGVVNFILDTDYEGFRIQGDSGITSRGDGFNYSFDAAAGLSFANGRGHVLASGGIDHRDGIFDIADRDWNQTGFVRIQDPTWTPTSTNPRFLIRTQVGAANSTPGGLITASTGGVPNRLRGLYFAEGGQIRQYRFGALTFPNPATAAPTLTQGGDWRINDSGRRIGLDAADDRRSFFGRISYEVADGVTLFAEGSYNWQEVFFNSGPNLATGIVLRADNAFLINAFNAAGRSLAGINTVTFATTARDLPFRVVNNRREVQRYVVGALGDFELFGNAAQWDVYGQYGRADLHEQLRNIMHTQRMRDATDAVFSIPGNTSSPIVCRINVDANPNNNDPGCVPINRLGIGVINPAAIPYVLGDPFRDQVVEQTVFGANLSFTPFETWAGDVSMAVGGEYRKEQIRGFVPPEFQPLVTAGGTTNRWSVGNYLPTTGEYDVKEAYFEAVVPLGLGLEFNGAARATDYSTSGYVTTWRAGATWQPIDDIRLRVTRSRDIRAPNLNELFQAGTANTDAVGNPFFNPATGTATPLNGVVYNTATIGYSGLFTGNLNLEPEKADSWNIGAVLSPRFIPGFRFSVDYFRIDLDGAIDTISPQSIINRCFEGLREYCDAITQDPDNASRILIRRQPFNFVRRLVRGVDFEATYRIPLGTLFPSAEGNFTLRGVATRYIENIADTGISTTTPINTVGVNSGQGSTPTWIYRATATYDSPRGSLTAVARGVSAGIYAAGAIECAPGSCPLSTLQAPTYEDNSISGSFYVDLNATMRFDAMGGGNGEFFVNVTNVFDADPILLPETGLAANSTYSDLLGRAFRVGVRLRMR